MGLITFVLSRLGPPPCQVTSLNENNKSHNNNHSGILLDYPSRSNSPVLADNDNIETSPQPLTKHHRTKRLLPVLFRSRLNLIITQHYC